MSTDPVAGLERESKDLVTTLRELPIIDAESYTAAGEWLKAVADYLRKVNTIFGPIVQKTHEAHKEAVRQRDGLLRPAEDAKRVLGVRMADWQAAEERKRR